MGEGGRGPVYTIQGIQNHRLVSYLGPHHRIVEKG